MRSTLPQALVWLSIAACGNSPVSYIGPVTDQSNPADSGAYGDTGAGSNSARACDERDLFGSCTRYTGAGWDDASIQSDCMGAIVDQCPEPALGGCTFAPRQPLEIVTWYYDGLYYSESDLTSLEADCLNGFGEWQ